MGCARTPHKVPQLITLVANSLNARSFKLKIPNTMKRLIPILPLAFTGSTLADILILTPERTLGHTLCVEGYIASINHPDTTALQILNKDGNPLRCKGKQHESIIGKK